MRLLERADRRRDRIRVLAYHRIDDPLADPDLEPGLISATPAEFRDQLGCLLRHYQPVSLAAVRAAADGGPPLPARAVLLTFDDAYRDFRLNAWPILREFGVPAALFVPTAFPDSDSPGFWWDRLHAALRRTDRPTVAIPGRGEMPLGDARARRAAYRLARAYVKSLPHPQAMAWVDDFVRQCGDVPPLLRVLDWASLRALASEGVAVCPHSHSHALMTRLERAARLDDLRAARARFAAAMGEDCSVMAYPANAVDADVITDLRETGYTFAFGGRRGVDRLPPAEPLDVQRLPVLRYGPALFRAQLRPLVARLASLARDGRAAY
jgi:peptidoglycan/xylan/chitin deacetylase (PgdA/CDA1 family)